MRIKAFAACIAAISAVVSSLPAQAKTVRGPRIEPVDVVGEKDIDFLSESAEWKLTTGWKPMSSWRCPENKTAGKHSLRIHTRIDLADGGEKVWPYGLNGLRIEFKEPVDWSEYNTMRFDMKLAAKNSRQKYNQLEVKLYRAEPSGKSHSWKACVLVKPSAKWRRVQIPFSFFARSGWGHRMPDGKRIKRIILGVYENCETHGSELDVLVDNFALLKTREIPWTGRCESGSALGELYIGAAEEMTILPHGAKQIPAVLGIVTGRDCFITREYTVRINFHELFTGVDYPLEMKCPGAVIPRAKLMMPVILDIEKLPPGFYLTTFDVIKDGKSVLRGRVGVDDFYIAKKGERIEHSLMSYQTAETFTTQDRKYGYMFKRVRASLPHTWNPLDPKTYTQFLLAHARDASFYIEDLHSSAITLTYAAEAFAAAGEPKRKAFAERMLKDLMKFMTGPIMLQKSGAIIQSGCALADNDAEDYPYGACAMKSTRIHDTSMSQTGYWFVCVTRAALYFAGPGRDTAYAKSLVPLLDRAAKFLTEHFATEIDGRAVLWNYHVLADLDLPKWRHISKGPTGKPKQGCCGTRSLTALAFYAYTRQLLAGSVPDYALKPLKDTAHWYADVIEKHDGWADPNSQDMFFEANMYLGEGYVGYYLYNKLIGDEKETERARRWANLTYRFITDRSMVGGKRAILEWNNWGGSWFTWSFNEYLQHLGHDDKLKWYADKIEEKWRSRGFRDIRHRQWYHRRADHFQDIPTTPYLGGTGDIDVSRSPGYRSPDKGAIYLSFLGPLAIYDMRAMGYKSRLLTPEVEK